MNKDRYDFWLSLGPAAEYEGMPCADRTTNTGAISPDGERKGWEQQPSQSDNPCTCRPGGCPTDSGAARSADELQRAADSEGVPAPGWRPGDANPYFTVTPPHTGENGTIPMEFPPFPTEAPGKGIGR